MLSKSGIVRTCIVEPSKQTGVACAVRTNGIHPMAARRRSTASGHAFRHGPGVERAHSATLAARCHGGA